MQGTRAARKALVEMHGGGARSLETRRMGAGVERNKERSQNTEQKSGKRDIAAQERECMTGEYVIAMQFVMRACSIRYGNFT